MLKIAFAGAFAARLAEPARARLALPATEPFHALDNVLLTPHISGWTEGTLAARAELIAENIARAVRGEAARNRVVPHASTSSA